MAGMAMGDADKRHWPVWTGAALSVNGLACNCKDALAMRKRKDDTGGDVGHVAMLRYAFDAQLEAARC